MADIEKFIHEQKELIEEEKVDGEEGDELLEYRYIRKPNGEIVIMAKPFFKLTPKELRDTENCMTNVPFDENDPDVKVYRLKNPEKFPQFKVDTGLEDRKNNMDVKGKKPREKDEPIKPLEEVKEKKAPEKTMEQVQCFFCIIASRMKEEGWNPADVYKEFEPDLPEHVPKKIVVKRKKAVWELIDDILHTDKPAMEKGGLTEFANEEQEELEEDAIEKMKREEERKQQRIIDQRLAAAAERIKEKREKEKRAKEEQKAKIEEEVKKQKEQEERERAERLFKKKQEEEARAKKLKEEQEALKRAQEIEAENRRKQQKIMQEKQELKELEDTIKKEANNTILLYDRSVCLNKPLTGYSLPDKLMQNQLTVQEHTFMRYQTIVIPVLDDFIILSKILPYFLLNSAIGLVHLEAGRGQYKYFPYNCVGCVMTVMAPPFNKPLFSLSAEIESKAKKVVILVFDTESSGKSEIISNDLKRVPLNNLVSTDELTRLNEGIKRYYNVTEQEAEYQKHVLGDKSTIYNLAIVMESTVDNHDTFKPVKPAWEILTRELSLRAFSVPGSSLPSNENEYENVCLLFKDITVNKSLENSIGWTFRRIFEKGLTVTGVRIGYIAFTDLGSFREKVVEEKADQRHAYLAIAVRGWDAFTKVCVISGPSDPQLAKTTDPNSLRAIFGNTREENCALPLMGVSKNAKDFAFWFSGRVNSKDRKSHREAGKKMFAVCREASSQATLFISPWIERGHYKSIIAICTKMGLLIQDVRIIDFKGVEISAKEFEKTAVKTYPGYKRNCSTGLALVIRKEGIMQCMEALKRKIMKECGVKYDIDKVLHVSYSFTDQDVKPEKTCCSLSDSFDNVLSEPTAKERSSKDLRLKYIAVIVPSENLLGQYQFAKAMKIVEQERFKLDQFETMALTIIRNLDSKELKKPVRDMLEKIRGAVKCKDFFLWILRGREIHKKLKDCYDYAKRQITIIDPKTNKAETYSGVVITDKASVEQLCDLYGHMKGRLYDDPFNDFSYIHDSSSVYPIPLSELSYTLTPCETNKVLVNVPSSMKESLGFCLIKPYKAPTRLLTRTIKSLSNVGLSLVDVVMVDLNEEQARLLYSLEYPEDEGKNYQWYTDHLQSEHCCGLLFKGKDTIYKMRKVIGVNNCSEEAKYEYLRFSFWKNEIENGFYFAEHYSHVETLKEIFFPHRDPSKPYINIRLDPAVNSKLLVRDLNVAPLEEIGLLIFSPTIVANGEYVYPTDSIVKEKCDISAICKGKLQEEEVKLLFGPPQKHSIEPLVIYKHSYCIGGGVWERRVHYNANHRRTRARQG
eukprot:TRINITY_DN120359_c1_g1_i1.p1 TRINITY_DN120359_c1_g1~~TRINITY_DN120359_c1_g1_i1.p1  ORF type:complete len:1307 (+),score=201.86 TRINITY_DN120359_c1_g1_i1:602-4522(+)